MITSISPSYNQTPKVNNFTNRQFNRTQNNVSFGDSGEKKTVTLSWFKAIAFAVSLLIAGTAFGTATAPKVKDILGIDMVDVLINGDKSTVSKDGTVTSYDSKSHTLTVNGDEFVINKNGNSVTVKNPETNEGVIAKVGDDGDIDIKLSSGNDSMNVNGTKLDFKPSEE